MTAADRLRAAVEEALPRPQTCVCEAADQRVCWMLQHGTDAGGRNPRCSCRCHLIPAVLAAVLPIVEERDTAIARLKIAVRGAGDQVDEAVIELERLRSQLAARDAEIARLRARHNPEVCVDVQEHCAAQAHELARLRAVLEWALVEDAEVVITAALRGDWAEVRNAGVALQEEGGKA